MNFALGANVDADGRAIENHDLWFKIQVSRDQDALLVAAGERPNRVAPAVSFNAELPDVLFTVFLHLVEVE
jgi:hypothetical protein